MTITELYAWCVDDPTGQHGIVGIAGPLGLPMQAVSSRRDLMEKMRPTVVEMAAIVGLPIQLLRFTTMSVLEEIKP